MSSLATPPSGIDPGAPEVDDAALARVACIATDVAHELNNVLAVLGTSARLVRETVRDALPPALAAEAEMDFDAIDEAVGRAGALTRRLLACSGAREVEPEAGGNAAGTGSPMAAGPE